MASSSATGSTKPSFTSVYSPMMFARPGARHEHVGVGGRCGEQLLGASGVGHARKPLARPAAPYGLGMRVAFLGLGRMGALMAGHVLSGGHDLVVWNRTPGKADALVERGAREAPSVSAAVAGADVVALMLFGPDSVRAVLAEVCAAAPPGTLVVDSTTVGPEAAREFAATADGGGLRYVDAPVAGSVGPAADGTLGVLAGGAQGDYDEALPLLHALGCARPRPPRRRGRLRQRAEAVPQPEHRRAGRRASASRCASAASWAWTASCCSRCWAPRATAGSWDRSGRCSTAATSAP